METYITTITVKAEPMNLKKARIVSSSRGKSLIVQGANLPEREAGYLVENQGVYLFVTKAEFEPYKCVETFLDRLRVERDELSERLAKLRGFTRTAWFDAFPEAKKSLMAKQEQAMSSYLTILTARIEQAEEDEK